MTAVVVSSYDQEAAMEDITASIQPAAREETLVDVVRASGAV